MIDGLKALYNDLGTRVKAYLYIEQLIRNWPCDFGIYIRGRWYRKRFKKCGANLQILQGAHILNPYSVKCGDNFFVGVNNYIQAGGGVIFGDNVMLGPYVMIWTQNHVFKDPDIPIWKQGYEFKPVVIGDNVWIGANAFIMPGAKIGNGCVISAYSVVGAKQYPDGTILSGNPARKIGDRFASTT